MFVVVVPFFPIMVLLEAASTLRALNTKFIRALVFMGSRHVPTMTIGVFRNNNTTHISHHIVTNTWEIDRRGINGLSPLDSFFKLEGVSGHKTIPHKRVLFGAMHTNASWEKKPT